MRRQPSCRGARIVSTGAVGLSGNDELPATGDGRRTTETSASSLPAQELHPRCHTRHRNLSQPRIVPISRRAQRQRLQARLNSTKLLEQSLERQPRPDARSRATHRSVNRTASSISASPWSRVHAACSIRPTAAVTRAMAKVSRRAPASR